MVSVWYVGALLLVHVASSAKAEGVCVSANAALNGCPAETPFSFTKERATTSRLAGDECGSEDLPALAENATPFIARPASLVKQQNLIADIVKRTRAGGNQVFTPSSTDARQKTPNGENILESYGLQPVPTPATGSCQYYAVAMSLLDMRFDTPQHVEALERMTQHLKTGIAEASRYGYEVEFPHDIRQAILASNLLEVEGLELAATMSEEESDALFQEYIDAIAQSPSDIAASLPLELWGTEVSLRMMAKLLQQPIFVVIAPYGLQTPPSYYQVYKPERIARSGRELDSAEAYFIPSLEPERWIAWLRQACGLSTSTANPPIVLLYSHSHYSRVQFVGTPAAT